VGVRLLIQYQIVPEYDTASLSGLHLAPSNQLTRDFCLHDVTRVRRTATGSNNQATFGRDELSGGRDVSAVVDLGKALTLTWLNTASVIHDKVSTACMW